MWCNVFFWYFSSSVFVEYKDLFALLVFVVTRCTMWRLFFTLTANRILKSFLNYGLMPGKLHLSDAFQMLLAVNIGHLVFTLCIITQPNLLYTEQLNISDQGSRNFQMPIGQRL